MSPVKKPEQSTWPPNPPLINTAAHIDPVGDVRVYRASSLGQCESALIAMALGWKGKMPESLTARLDEGTAAEPVILKAAREAAGLRAVTYPEIAALKAEGLVAGYNPELQQIQVRINVGKGAVIAGHLDGIAVDEDERYTEEAKALGPDLYKKWKKEGIRGFPGYARQVSVGMIATGMPCRFSVGRKGAGGVVAPEDVETVLIEQPPVSKAELLALVMRCEKWAKSGEVPACVKVQWPCLVFDHECHPNEEQVERELVTDPVLGNMLARYVAYGDDERAAKKEREELKAGVDKRLADVGLERGVKYVAEDEAGNRVEFEWVVEDVEEATRTVKAYQRNTLRTKLVT